MWRYYTAYGLWNLESIIFGQLDPQGSGCERSGVAGAEGGGFAEPVLLLIVVVPAKLKGLSVFEYGMRHPRSRGANKEQ